MLSTPLILVTLATLATPSVGLRRRDDIPLPPDTFTKISSSTDLVWQPCLSEFFCAVLDVPIDYQYPNGTRAFVPLIKYSATAEPYKGLVLVNPGGPGESGVEFLANNTATLADVVGPYHDVVSWEPRGLKYAMPTTNCTGSLPKILGIQERSFASSDKLHGPYLLDVFFEEDLQSSKDIGEVCQSLTGGPDDAGPHMTTSVVVKDMISILDAYVASDEGKTVDDASLLNFWGFSYGTIIGQTFASMYPDRIGRVALDGVADADDYISGNELKNLQLADEAFSTFFVYCHLAGPVECPYYTGTTAHDIFLRFEATLERLDTETASKNQWSNATAITLALEGLKFTALTASYSPIENFPLVVQVALAMEDISQNATIDRIQELKMSLGIDFTLNSVGAEWTRAVSCTDIGSVLYNQSLADIAETLKTLKSQSYIRGELWETNRINCFGWSIHGTERFAGPFGGATKNPILFVSNTRDPVTPIYNGQRATQLFSESQLLTIDATGHTSLAAENKCANAKLNAFFQNGTLLGNNNCCALEAGPWNITLSSLEEMRDWESVQVKKFKSRA